SQYPAMPTTGRIFESMPPKSRRFNPDDLPEPSVRNAQLFDQILLYTYSILCILRQGRPVAHAIHSELVELQGDIDELPRLGPIGAELVARDYEGKSLIEFVLPNRFDGGPEVPFKASWWLVDPGEVTPEDCHQVQELWFVGRGVGTMRFGDEE